MRGPPAIPGGSAAWREHPGDAPIPPRPCAPEALGRAGWIDRYVLKILSIVLPLASSSTNLSRYRIFCINGSSMSSTRTPHTKPVICDVFGLRRASAKKALNVVPAASWLLNAASSKPGQPLDHLVQFRPRASLLLHLCNIEGIDRSETGGKDPAHPGYRSRWIGGSGARHSAAHDGAPRG